MVYYGSLSQSVIVSLCQSQSSFSRALVNIGNVEVNSIVTGMVRLVIRIDRIVQRIVIIARALKKKNSVGDLFQSRRWKRGE